jgi:hypothetical protein
MAIHTTYVIPPVFSAAEVVVLLSTGMTAEAGLGDFFRWLSLKGNDFGWIAFLCVRLARTVTRFATCHLSFPTTDVRELSMRSVRESLELIFVTIFASFTTNVTFGSRSY